MPKPIGEVSKRRQLAEILKRRYGGEMETPSPKDIKVWEAHKALDKMEFEAITAFVGMYAGYFIFTEPDFHTQETVYIATKLRRKLHRFEYNGEIHIIGGRNSRWVFGSSPSGIVDSIIYRMVENCGYRGGGGPEITRQQLPAHLRPYLSPSDWDK